MSQVIIVQLRPKKQINLLIFDFEIKNHKRSIAVHSRKGCVNLGRLTTKQKESKNRKKRKNKILFININIKIQNQISEQESILFT